MHSPVDHDESAPVRRRRAVPPAAVSPAAALPAVQPRARATRDAMLRVGRALLQERDFDELSIADLAAANGLSVGSFYGRFRDKASFFALLQQQVTEEWLERGRAFLALTQGREPDARRIVSQVCAVFVDVMRRDAEEAVDQAGAASVRVDVTFDTPWTTNRLTEAGRAALLKHGRAPPYPCRVRALAGLS
jgi:AcrR family transcriptional regulator